MSAWLRSLDGSWVQLAAPIFAFVLLGLATGSVWEFAHDEGVTFDQAVGHLPLRAGEPVPVSSLYATVKGESEYGPADVVDALMQPYGMHPPAYYLLLNAWTRLAGTDRIPMSLPAYVFGILSIVAMARLAKQVLPRAATAFAPWLLALSPWMVGYTVLARPYAMALCVALWATTSLLSAQGATRRLAWNVAFVLLSILGLHTIYHYSFVLAWQVGLAGLLSYRKSPGERAGAYATLSISVLCIAVGFLPWLPRFLEHLEKTQAQSWYFSGGVALAEWPQQLLELVAKFALADANWTAEAHSLGLGLWALVVATLGFALLTRTEAPLPEPLASSFWWSVPLLPALIIAADLIFDDRSFFISKTCFFFLPLLLLGLAYALARAGASARRLLFGGWVLLFVGSVASIVYAYSEYTSDYAHIARYLSQRDLPGHHVVVNTSAPGYAVPFVLASSAAGLRNVDVTYAPPRELTATIDALTSRAGVTQLTLLHFNATYQQDELWESKLVQRALQRALPKGWRSRSAAPLDLAAPKRAEKKLIVVVSPVRARNFSD